MILDGVEKAERNVLPILNNLIENREMSLEDGRFLVAPKRFDMLCSGENQNELNASKLVRVSERFLVIALGLPIPKYDGYPLDPPFRSRFQARFVGIPSAESQFLLLKPLFPNIPSNGIERVVSACLTIQNFASDQGAFVPDFPPFLNRFIAILHKFSGLDARDCLELVYPYPFLANGDAQMNNVVFSIIQRFQLHKVLERAPIQFKELIGPIQRKASLLYENPLNLAVASFTSDLKISLSAGNNESANVPYFVETEYHSMLLTLLIQAHSVGDFCIIGEKGSGKSLLLRKFARLFGYRTEYIPLYKDLSARDLLQRRTTTDRGDTIWENAGLVNAALHGYMAVLDPVDVLSAGTLGSIQRIVMEREFTLPNGTVLIHPNRYESLMKRNNWTRNDLSSRSIFPVHPSFRVVALARPINLLSSQRGSWLNAESLSMFSFVPMRPMKIEEETAVLLNLFPHISKDVVKAITALAHSLRHEKDDTLKDLAGNFSTRQLLRIARRLSVFPKDSIYSCILKVSLYRFLPVMAKEALLSYVSKHNIVQDEPEALDLQVQIIVDVKGIEVLKIGDVECPTAIDSNPLLVPNILFYENQRQITILQDVLKDYTLGEHLLLIGNQGVGKNKIVDYFLQKMKLPREYIQLHRDTTVYSLTSSPAIVNGKLVYEDSPLVKAVREGYILVVDEADKAPTHVTQILKCLVEDGEMVLSDGRRIVSEGHPESNSAHIVIHPNFRMFVLANRPGFPFLGNNCYAEIGDVFAAHCIDNPDPDSELGLLKKYAPSIPEDVLRKLIASFTDLRRLADEGLINYPYSTRELVNVVKHLHTYPVEGLSRALQNVFDFDNEDEIRNILVETMNKNGIPTGMKFSFKVELAAESTLPGPILIEKWRNGRVEMIRGSQKDMNVRGTWRLDIPAKWDVLEQKNGRAAKFSEWLYSFKLFPSGSPSDLIMGADQHLYAISTSPVNLIIVSPEHRKQKTIHLYEFIPASRVTRLSLAEIGVGKIAIHNSQEHSIITLDLQNSTISPILLAQLDHVYDSYLADGSIDGFNGILSFPTNFSRLSAKDWGNSFC